jgi:hypothetical protein
LIDRWPVLTAPRLCIKYQEASSPWQKSEFYKTHGISAKR